MKMNSQFTITALVTALIGCSACSVKTSGGSADPFSGPHQAQLLSADINGIWSTGCHLNQGNGEIDRMTFTGQNFTSAVAQYSDTSCAGPAMLNYSFQGRYSLGSTSNTEPGAYNLDLQLTGSSGNSASIPSLILFDGTFVGSAMYLPDSGALSAGTRPAHVDRTVAYTKISN